MILTFFILVGLIASFAAVSAANNNLIDRFNDEFNSFFYSFMAEIVQNESDLFPLLDFPNSLAEIVADSPHDPKSQFFFFSTSMNHLNQIKSNYDIDKTRALVCFESQLQRFCHQFQMSVDPNPSKMLYPINVNFGDFYSTNPQSLTSKKPKDYLMKLLIYRKTWDLVLNWSINRIKEVANTLFFYCQKMNFAYLFIDFDFVFDSVVDSITQTIRKNIFVDFDLGLLFLGHVTDAFFELRIPDLEKLPEGAEIATVVSEFHKKAQTVLMELIDQIDDLIKSKSSDPFLETPWPVFSERLKAFEKAFNCLKFSNRATIKRRQLFKEMYSFCECKHNLKLDFDFEKFQHEISRLLSIFLDENLEEIQGFQDLNRINQYLHETVCRLFDLSFSVDDIFLEFYPAAEDSQTVPQITYCSDSISVASTANSETESEYEYKSGADLPVPMLSERDKITNCLDDMSVALKHLPIHCINANIFVDSLSGGSDLDEIREMAEAMQSSIKRLATASSSMIEYIERLRKYMEHFFSQISLDSCKADSNFKAFVRVYFGNLFTKWTTSKNCCALSSNQTEPFSLPSAKEIIENPGPVLRKLAALPHKMLPDAAAGLFTAYHDFIDRDFNDQAGPKLKGFIDQSIIETLKLKTK